MKGKSFSRVRLLATSWTVVHQAPLSMGFSRQEYWSGVPLPSPSRIHNWTEMLINRLGKNLLLVTSHKIYIRDILKLENFVKLCVLCLIALFKKIVIDQLSFIFS